MKSWEMRAENCSDLVKSLNYLATDICWSIVTSSLTYPLTPIFYLEKITYVFKEEETNMILSLFNVFNIYGEVFFPNL